MYLHELAADENGRSFAAVVNRKLGLGVVIDFDASLFPYFMEWKSTGAGDYVVGLEPSNSSVHGRGWHEQRGDLHAIAPQASERKSLTFTVIEGEAAIDGLIARRDAARLNYGDNIGRYVIRRSHRTASRGYLAAWRLLSHNFFFSVVF